MSDSFSMHVFKDSFRKVFEPDEAGLCAAFGRAQRLYFGPFHGISWHFMAFHGMSSESSMVSLPDGLPEAGLQREDRGLHQQGVQVLRRGGWPQLAGQEGALGGGDRDRRGQHLPMGASEGPLGDMEYTI